MGEVCHAADLFSERSRFVQRRRERGKYPDDERPVALVIAHTILPANKSEKPNATKTKSTKAVVERRLDPDPSDVRARSMDTISFARTGAPPTTPQPHLSDGKVAHASIQQAQFALVRTIEKLKRESDGSSTCIGDLRAILVTLEVNLPKLAQ